MSTQFWIKFAFAVIVLNVASFVTSVWIPISEAYRIIFGIFFLLFIPGFTWSYVINPKMDQFERAIVSIALSMVFIPFAMFIASKFGVKPNTTNITIEVVIVTSLAIIALYIQKLLKDKHVFFQARTKKRVARDQR